MNRINGEDIRIDQPPVHEFESANFKISIQYYYITRPGIGHFSKTLRPKSPYCGKFRQRLQGAAPQSRQVREAPLLLAQFAAE
jgi:hypothetical protein